MQASAELWIDDSPPELFEDIGKQVFLEVLDLMLALSPLQGAWFKIGIGQIGAIALRVLGWELEATPAADLPLRARWPELVPGYAAMDRLLGLMVDYLCR